MHHLLVTVVTAHFLLVCASLVRLGAPITAGAIVIVTTVAVTAARPEAQTGAPSKHGVEILEEVRG
jgi:hypothetical protein